MFFSAVGRFKVVIGQKTKLLLDQRYTPFKNQTMRSNISIY